jgi:hypothetical protein
VAQIYNREAILQVGVPGQEGRDFTGLRVSFQIEKTSESNSNTSRISVYNLNKENRSFVEQEGLNAILKVGYTPPGSETLSEIIFQGDTKKVENKLQGADWLTTFEVGDGEAALVNSKFNKSFSKGLSLSSAIDEVAKTLGKPISVIQGIKDKVFKNGLTLSGSTKEILDSLTLEGGVEWSIQDDEIIILPPTGTDGETAFLISRDTGLIGSPIKREKGIELITALNPKIRPGRQIQVESKFLKGLFRVRKVIHDGDSLEGNWQSKVEAV